MSDHLEPHALTQLALSLTESSRRDELEQVIAQGLATFVMVGKALLEMRDSRLYRDTHATFEDYCRERWEMSRIHAHRMIEAAGVASNLLPIGNVQPTHESQVRPLAGLEPEDQREAWDAAVQSAPNGKVTAAHVARVAEVIKAATKPAPATKAAEPVRPPPSETVLNKALERIKNVAGKLVHAEVRGGLIPDKWDVIAFSKLPEAEMRDVAPLLRRGRIYSAAVDEVAGRLSPDDEIRALHTKAVAAGGRLQTTVAGFVHVVVMEDRAQELEARLKGW